jgi:DNA/RNA-binding domain of Phe-tRNA-synthetase-like protein
VPVEGQKEASRVRLAVDEKVWELFPGMRLVVAVAGGLDNTAGRPGVEAAWRGVWAEVAEEARRYDNAQSHPRVRAWREAMGAVGVSGRRFPSSAEALLRRALKEGEPPLVNPLVDFYNLVSLKHVVPVGGFDLDEVGDLLELRLTHEGDTFAALDGSPAENVGPGEVAYASESTVLTRHFVWRQSREGLITGGTRSALLVSEILGDTDGGLTESVLGELRSGLIEHFDAEPASFVLEKGSPSAYS